MPAIWLPTPQLRHEREISRWRLHLVKHPSTLNNRVRSTLIAFGQQVPMADVFGLAGRQLLESLKIPEPWRGHVDASLELIDELDDIRAFGWLAALRRCTALLGRHSG